MPAPVFTDGPRVINITVDGFDIEVETDQHCTVCSVVTGDGAFTPDSQQVYDAVIYNDGDIDLGGGNVYTCPRYGYGYAYAGQLTQITMSGNLAAATDYDCYVVATNNIPQLQAQPTLVEATTSGSEGANFLFPPEAVAVRTDGFDVRFQVDAETNVYAVVVPAGATAPTGTQVIDAQFNSGDFITHSLRYSYPDSDDYLALETLTPDTAYDCYVVPGGHAQPPEPALIEVTTAELAPFVLARGAIACSAFVTLNATVVGASPAPIPTGNATRVTRAHTITRVTR